ncbi:glutamine-rich protein 2 isoform A [Patagioenas fasciata monilis]|uniref:Glutamine-rich protein 2 isoform A n=1 Tax=Patagioenas fasciata monilis TaxID=372326 RepID=A0A1V4KXK9_PATFA|nr:glutamine-rich protein 2 isoform A [Patagioenas fasciata monilis]
MDGKRAGQSPTSCLGKDQDTKEQPGQEEEEDGAPGTGQQPQEPEEQLLRKDTLERTRSNAEITSMVKELTAKEEEQEICKGCSWHFKGHSWMPQAPGMETRLCPALYLPRQATQQRRPY